MIAKQFTPTLPILHMNNGGHENICIGLKSYGQEEQVRKMSATSAAEQELFVLASVVDPDPKLFAS